MSSRRRQGGPLDRHPRREETVDGRHHRACRAVAPLARRQQVEILPARQVTEFDENGWQVGRAQHAKARLSVRLYAERHDRFHLAYELAGEAVGEAARLAQGEVLEDVRDRLRGLAALKACGGVSGVFAVGEVL